MGELALHPNGNPSSSELSCGPLCARDGAGLQTLFQMISFKMIPLDFALHTYVSLFSFQYDFPLLNMKDLTQHFSSFILKINSHDNKVELAS